MTILIFMAILISNRSRRAVPTSEMSDEQAGSLNEDRARAEDRNAEVGHFRSVIGGVRASPLVLPSRLKGFFANRQRPFIALEQDTLRGAFEIIVLTVPQRPHECGKPGEAHADRNRDEKEEINHRIAPGCTAR